MSPLLPAYGLSFDHVLALPFVRHFLKAIQHDAQSLRHAAIQRYLKTRDRIDVRYKRNASLIILAVVTVLCVVLFIGFYAG